MMIKRTIKRVIRTAIYYSDAIGACVLALAFCFMLWALTSLTIAVIG